MEALQHRAGDGVRILVHARMFFYTLVTTVQVVRLYKMAVKLMSQGSRVVTRHLKRNFQLSWHFNLNVVVVYAFVRI